VLSSAEVHVDLAVLADGVTVRHREREGRAWVSRPNMTSVELEIAYRLGSSCDESANRGGGERFVCWNVRSTEFEPVGSTKINKDVALVSRDNGQPGRPRLRSPITDRVYAWRVSAVTASWQCGDRDLVRE